MYTLSTVMEQAIMRIARGVRPTQMEAVKKLLGRGYISVDENELTASGYVLSDETVRYLQENYPGKFDGLISEAKLKVKKAIKELNVKEDSITAQALLIIEEANSADNE